MNKCPKCSMEFSADALGGLCPACLLQQGVESEAAATSGPEITTVAAPTTASVVDPVMSPEQLMALLPQFDQIELIGRGGMGVVYKARQKNLDRPVALKVLLPEVAGSPGFAERFAREARAMARLSHPNIVTVHDFGAVENSGVEFCYFTMEYVEGSNLRGLLKRLSSEQALAIVPQMCEALQYAHDIGIVHRDIKPENILVDKKGRVKIADFGLAKLLEQARTSSDYTLTQADMAMGTPAYMAPEQLERPTEVDHRADLYSLGVVFYEMLTGQLPKGRFQLPSQRVQIDVRFDDVVLKALEHDRELRYQHASEVQTSVESVRSTMRPATSLSEARAVVENLAIQTPPAADRSLPIAPTTGPVAREPGRFYPKAFGLYFVAWVAFLLLWNLGWPGFIASVVIFSVVARLQARRLQTYRPQIVAARQAEPRWKKVCRPSNINAQFTLGFLLILLGIGLFGDHDGNPEVAKIFNDHELTDTSRAFLKDFQSYNPKGLSADVRDLTLRTSIASGPYGMTAGTGDEEPLPASVLQTVNPWSYRYPSAIPPEFRPPLFYCVATLLGLVFFMAGFADMLSSKGHRFSGLAWKPALSLTAILIASYLAVVSCRAVIWVGKWRFSDVQVPVLDGGKRIPWWAGTSRATESLFPALDRWAIDHGYEIAALEKGELEDTHRFPGAPTNVTYQAVVLWKPGLFDRLHMDLEGMYSRAPEILVQSAGADSFTLVTITVPAWSSWSPAWAETAAGNALNEDLNNTLVRELTRPPPAATRPASSQPVASGGAAGPATAPDLSEPLGLLRAWADALGAGDFPTAEALCVGPKETLRQMEVDSQQALELVRLNDSMSQVFGHNPNIASGPTAQAREVVRQVFLQATVLKTDPDLATAYPQASNKMTLRRIDGQWKLDWIASYLSADYQPRPGDLALYRGFYVLPVQRLTADVLARKFKTLDEATAAYNHLRSDWNRIPIPLRDDMTRKQASDVADRYWASTTQPAATQSAGPSSRP